MKAHPLALRSSLNYRIHNENRVKGGREKKKKKAQVSGQKNNRGKVGSFLVTHKNKKKNIQGEKIRRHNRGNGDRGREGGVKKEASKVESGKKGK